MREIKFRAWDTQAEEILYGVEHTYDGYKVPMPSFGALLDCPDFYVVMQYTGLKDKTGKEIYEGDIVHFKTLRSKEYIGEVKSYEDAASFFVVAKEHYMECLDDVYELEVLGNIYENKGLLNA
ncbi:YopX family protein [Campylobacter concisus]|uniref:YopX family protein n=1 Tax=Campylobacter concisus TaxID=199 RepID=UPI00122CDDB9|nr:YopX family protein [Campylobacter concisus]